MRHIILVNFGGPRTLLEIESFLKELLNDRDVIWTKFPSWLHRWIFNRVAKKRAGAIQIDYEKIGGKSPIFEDTETIAESLRSKGFTVTTFHRYLPKTHQQSIEKILLAEEGSLIAFPLFPQFSYATTGSVARFFSQKQLKKVSQKIQWVKSYSEHPAYVLSMQRAIRSFLEEKKVKESDVFLLFSAHGVPEEFIDQGDPYRDDCINSFHKIKEGFPQATTLLSFQSKFGKGEWIKPYTVDVCQKIKERPELYLEGGKLRTVMVVPLSFTSDHIETLYEIEHQYVPLIQEAGVEVFRVPAMGLDPGWLNAIEEIIETSSLVSNEELYR